MDKKQPKLKSIKAWAMTCTDSSGTSILDYVLYRTKQDAIAECNSYNGAVRVKLTPLGPIHRRKEASK